MNRVLIMSVSFLMTMATRADDLAERVDEALTKREKEVAERLPPKADPKRSKVKIEILGDGRYKHDGKKLDTKGVKKILQPLDRSKTTVWVKANNDLLHSDLVKFFELLAEMRFEDVTIEGFTPK